MFGQAGSCLASCKIFKVLENGLQKNTESPSSLPHLSGSICKGTWAPLAGAYAQPERLAWMDSGDFMRSTVEATNPPAFTAFCFIFLKRTECHFNKGRYDVRSLRPKSPTSSCKTLVSTVPFEAKTKPTLAFLEGKGSPSM